MDYFQKIYNCMQNVYQNLQEGIHNLAYSDFVYGGFYSDSFHESPEGIETTLDGLFGIILNSKRGKGGREKKKPKQGISTHSGKKSSRKVTIDPNGKKHVHRKRRGSRK